MRAKPLVKTIPNCLVRTSQMSSSINWLHGRPDEVIVVTFSKGQAQEKGGSRRDNHSRAGGWAQEKEMDGPQVDFC
jgi:hypothetical protein